MPFGLPHLFATSNQHRQKESQTDDTHSKARERWNNYSMEKIIRYYSDRNDQKRPQGHEKRACKRNPRQVTWGVNSTEKAICEHSLAYSVGIRPHKFLILSSIEDKYWKPHNKEVHRSHTTGERQSLPLLSNLDIEVGVVVRGNSLVTTWRPYAFRQIFTQGVFFLVVMLPGVEFFVTDFIKRKYGNAQDHRCVAHRGPCHMVRVDVGFEHYNDHSSNTDHHAQNSQDREPFAQHNDAHDVNKCAVALINRVVCGNDGVL